MDKSVRAFRLAALLAGILMLLLTGVPAVLVRRQRTQGERDHALIRAIQNKNAPVALNLLQRGADADARQSLPPEVAFLDVLRYLTERNYYLTFASRRYEASALQLAVEKDLAPVVKALLLRHARDINAHAHEGYAEGRSIMEKDVPAQERPLVVLVTQKNHPDLAWMFLQRGVTLTKDDREALLCAAVDTKNADLARYLLETGTDANGGATFDEYDSPSKQVPLWYAVENRDLTTTRLLLEHGARARVADGDATLTDAARNGDLAMIRLLLAHGAEVNKAVRFGTPLCFAAENNHLEAVKTLIAAGADADYHGYGGSVLDHALEADVKQSNQKQTQEQIIALLLQHRANPNRANRGYYRLTLVAGMGRTRIAEMMLVHGANISVEDRDGSTPLSDAVEANHLEMVKLLLRHKARVGFIQGLKVTGAGSDNEVYEHFTIDIRNLAKTAAMRRLLNQYR